MAEAAQPTGATRGRPVAIAILAGLILFKAVLIGALVVGTAVQDTRVSDALGLPNVLGDARDTAAGTAFLVIVAALLVVSALGLLAGRRFGWLLAMVMTGAFIAADIVAFLGGHANHLWMLLNIVTVFYLNQRDVRERFLASDTTDGPDAPETVAA